MLSLSETFPEYGKAMSKILVGTLEKIDDYTDTANFGNVKVKKKAIDSSKDNTSNHKPLTLAEAKHIREEKELQEWKEKNYKTVDKHKDNSDDLAL